VSSKQDLQSQIIKHRTIEMRADGQLLLSCSLLHASISHEILERIIMIVSCILERTNSQSNVKLCLSLTDNIHPVSCLLTVVRRTLDR
jgi:hypothetical protein